MALEMQEVTVPKDVARIIMCKIHEATVIRLSEPFMTQLWCKHCNKPMSDKWPLPFNARFQPNGYRSPGS